MLGDSRRTNGRESGIEDGSLTSSRTPEQHNFVLTFREDKWSTGQSNIHSEICGLWTVETIGGRIEGLSVPEFSEPFIF
jgi:hypothetical protein